MCVCACACVRVCCFFLTGEGNYGEVFKAKSVTNGKLMDRTSQLNLKKKYILKKKEQKNFFVVIICVPEKKSNWFFVGDVYGIPPPYSTSLLLAIHGIQDDCEYVAPTIEYQMF